MTKIITAFQETLPAVRESDFDWNQKRCTRCGETKHAKEFYRNDKKKYGSWSVCKSCMIKESQENHAKNRERHLSKMAEYRHRARIEAIMHYGGKCECCGESQIEFLAIDHINGGGNKHQKEIHGMAIGIWLRKNGYPDGFRVLCHNCNMARGFLGYCPHEKESP